MADRRFLLLSALVLTAVLLLSARRVSGQRGPSPIVRLAVLNIDPSQLEGYRAALKTEIETSIRVESGVLSLYAVSEKADPSRITIFETYVDDDAYRAHLQTPHFKQYKTGTQGMVKSLKLIEAEPIVLGAKPR